MEPKLELPAEWNFERILREEREETGSEVKLTKEINKEIRMFRGAVGIFKKNPTQSNMNNLRSRDVLISAAIQDHFENDLPEEPEESNTTENNLPSMTPEQEALAARAKAVGLPETASEADIIAAETAAAGQNQGDSGSTEGDDAAGKNDDTPPPPPPPPVKKKSSGVDRYFAMDDDDDDEDDD